ncbi:hypothetical membrane protein [Thermococcus kodakarensis KOD1]|uniref:Hypothetical membrane protein n=1 Tax=Thermococcus kodakarensis (strain ATCC BAA-918 / JCM 12380 / KOD1) TaxID=69014 RepID=Q5JD12_THEKO|nr:hypothetical protein [Thermococcus kodakarensis]WCN28490.1 hypothetical protein POG15_02140 [Thermococcus kodakarensis]WCN30786.1 hypothetical protein POG21_02140 [Thermococcus kodakarensis]BAD84606.1 hypothetical membrane protein [Thermococcus kodakarensis KOD1]
MKSLISLYAFSAMIAPVLTWFILGAVIVNYGTGALMKVSGLVSIVMGMLSLFGFREYYNYKNAALIIVNMEDIPRLAKALKEREGR